MTPPAGGTGPGSLPRTESASFDAVLLVSFGGPEGPDEVWPFLRRVTRGRGVPDERLAEVAEHYQLFGGRSPINDQNRALLGLLREALAPRPVYWGNRNSDPFLADTVAEMVADGVRTAAIFITAAYASYSSCRQYREDLAEALAAQPVPCTIQWSKLRHYYNHPGFVEAQTDRVREALRSAGDAARLVFTAHSIPTVAADSSGPPDVSGAYPHQLAETARLVAETTGKGDAWDLVYQSRSGPPTVPWLEPDVLDHLERLAAAGVDEVVLVPSGFVSDHLEVAFDLDVEAVEAAERLGIRLGRAGTVGTHPRFVEMVRELVEERERVELGRTTVPRPVVGRDPVSHDRCPLGCCPGRVPRAAAAGLPEDLQQPARATG